MGRSVPRSRRKPRLRTELSEDDEARLREAAALFGLPKAEVVRRLIRAAVQAGPALSAGNAQVILELAAQTRTVGRNLSQLIKAIDQGRAIGLEDTEAVWRELFEAIAAINDELTEITIASGSRLRGQAGLGSRGETSSLEAKVE